MKWTFAFDVYGTLIDTSGVYDALSRMVGQDATSIMQTWRSKQLEYSFRRGLMGQFVDFSVVTREALDYACLQAKVTLSDDQKEALMVSYKTLPAFPDVESGLSKIRPLGHRMFAFSNGSYAAINGLLQHARVATLFDGMISVEGIKTFKPDPGVYEHFCRQTRSPKEQACLVSGNPFDVIGALAFGMKAIWLKRSNTKVFDPMPWRPSLILSSLVEIPERLGEL